MSEDKSFDEPIIIWARMSRHIKELEYQFCMLKAFENNPDVTNNCHFAKFESYIYKQMLINLSCFWDNSEYRDSSNLSWNKMEKELKRKGKEPTLNERIYSLKCFSDTAIPRMVRNKLLAHHDLEYFYDENIDLNKETVMKLALETVELYYDSLPIIFGGINYRRPYTLEEQIDKYSEDLKHICERLGSFDE